MIGVTRITHTIEVGEVVLLVLREDEGVVYHARINLPRITQSERCTDEPK